MLNRKPMNNIVSIDTGRVAVPDPDPSPTSAASAKRKGPKTENQFSRRRFFTLSLGPLLWSEEKAAKETGYDVTKGKAEIKTMAAREWERQNRKAA